MLVVIIDVLYSVFTSIVATTSLVSEVKPETQASQKAQCL